jgi:glutamate synthase domain-containing protein 2
MSVVIVGGHDRMVCEYKKICNSFNCKAKIFTQMTGSLKSQIGAPDLLILFTNTVSHKMIQSAAQEGLRKRINIAKSHTSSSTALKNILEEYCQG